MFRAFGPIFPLQTLQSIGNSFVHLKFAHVASIQLPAAILALQFWSPAKILMTYCKIAKAACYTAINDGMEFLFPLRRIFHIVHTKEEIYLLFNMEATVVIVYMFIEFHGRCWKSQLP